MQRSSRGSAVAIFVVALAVRGGVALWGGSRFTPAEDGHFYHVVATRIAEGLGYTWLWPDGAVTYAAHYPVGYPGLIALGYWLFGASPGVAMGGSAVLGSFAAVAAARIVSSYVSATAGLLAGLLVAFHPALVAYTPALMTEGVTASLLMIAGWLSVYARAAAARRRALLLVALGCISGLAVLVRPQCLLLAPLFGVMAASGGRGRTTAAALVTGLAVLVCTPWTLRNCERMGRCVFVSANGGWNLLIGTAAEGRGSWVPLERIGVPEACRNEFREAFKDQCFGHAALERIREAPLAWLSLVPDKLSATFDYSGAPGWYLHASNPRAVPERAKVWLGAFETLVERVLLAVALGALALRTGRFAAVRVWIAAAGAVSLLAPIAWPAYLAVPVLAVLRGRRVLEDPAALLAGGAVLATALAHALFFGAGRYSMICFPMIAALAGSAFGPGLYEWWAKARLRLPGIDGLLTRRSRAGDTSSRRS
ncbi:MAG TPA: glycosyltransferase family 39 protein [Polyangiaceae bacterium]